MELVYTDSIKKLRKMEKELYPVITEDQGYNAKYEWVGNNKRDTFNWYDGTRYIYNSGNGHNVEIVSSRFKFEVMIRRNGDLFNIKKYYISYDEKYNLKIYKKGKKFFCVNKNHISNNRLYKYYHTDSFFSITYIRNFYRGDLLKLNFNTSMFLGAIDRKDREIYAKRNRHKLFSADITIDNSKEIKIPLWN